MYTEKMFDEIKSVMLDELKKVTLNDFPRYLEWVEKHHIMINQLIDIEKFNVEFRTEVVEIIKDDKLNNNDDEVLESEFAEPYPIGRTFTILKKAYGGVIDGLNYPIPEELMRTRMIENGYKIQIIGIKGTFTDGSPRYEFEIVEEEKVDNPQLREVLQGVVEFSRGRYIVSKTADGRSIRVDEDDAILYVNDKDTAKYRIREGDIINGRFYSNNITSTFRVTYKYDIEETTSIKTVEERRLTHRQNNPTESEQGLSMIDRLDTTPFLNKKIVLVGLESRMNDFKKSLQKAPEIELVHFSGDEHKSTIKSQLRKANYVLLSTKEASHDVTYYCAEVCNELGVPCTSVHGDGLFSVLTDCKKLIDQTDEVKAS